MLVLTTDIVMIVVKIIISIQNKRKMAKVKKKIKILKLQCNTIPNVAKLCTNQIKKLSEKDLTTRY